MINAKYTTTKDWAFLVGAVVLTVLHIVFAEPIQTCFYYGSDEFADAMYENNLYFSLALYISLEVWVLGILYYWIIDNVRLSSFAGWAVFCILAVACAPGIAYFFPMDVFDSENLEFNSQLPTLALTSIPLALVLYIIVSLGCKNLSRNCSTRPF